MNREEAIMILKNEQPHCGKRALFPEEKRYEAYDVAIKALEQQTCEDAVSREAVLKIQAKYAEYMGATKFWQMHDDVKALPPVNPQSKWIPVSEGMPNVTNYYLIQHTRRICNDEMAVAFYSVEEAHVDPNYTWEFVTHSDVQEVIAWMPLPALYEHKKGVASNDNH